MKILIIVLFCFMCKNVFPAKIYDVEYLGVQDGMTSNYVHDIVQDKTGLLWFATEEGLNRFDGSRFFTYYKERRIGRSISCDELSGLLDDPKCSVLWIGTQNDGLNVYDYENNEFRYYCHDDNKPYSIAENCVTDLYASSDGHIWIATYSGGIDRFRNGDTKFVHFNTKTVGNLPDDKFWCVLDDGHGRLFAGHVSCGLSVIDIKTRKAVNFRHSSGNNHSISGDEVTCLYKDKRGRIWVGTDAGVDVFNSQNGTFKHVAVDRLGRQRIYDIKEFSDGRIWIGTERLGIMAVDPESVFKGVQDEAYTFIDAQSGTCHLNGNDVRCLYEDKFGQIWAGLWEGGVNLLTTVKPLFQLIGSSVDGVTGGLTDKSVMGLCFDRDGMLWAGTNSFGLNVLSKSFALQETFPTEIGPCVQTAFCDSDGKLWFGCYNGGLFVRLKDGFRKILPKGTEDVRVLFEDKRRQMWIGTSNGVFIVDIGTLTVKRRMKTESNLIRAIASDADGNVWIGSYGGGIEIYSPQYSLLRRLNAGTKKGNLMPSNIVTQIIMDSNSHIWVATNDGALCFESAVDMSPKLYDRKAGLENSHIRAIIEDGSKNIWLSTNKGICCLTAGTRDVINFTYRDNVPINNFNDRCAAKSSDGRIFFGSAGNGICYFDPRLVLTERPAPRVMVTSLYLLRGIENRDSLIFLAGKKNICLGYDENNFRIGFVVSNFAINDQVEYSYKIEGLQDDWLVTQSDQIVLQDVPHGRYRLMIRARFHNQKWSETETFLIEILPPLWLTWWAKLIYCIMILTVFVLVIRSYKRHLSLKYQLRAEKVNHEQELRLNEERLRFFTNITHELRTPVTLILGPLDDIAHASGVPEKIKHTLAVCYQSAVRLNELINQILEFRKVESNRRQLKVAKQNIVDVVYNVVMKYMELVQKPDLNFHFTTDDDSIEIYFDKDVIEIVMDNLMSNAIKYTSHGDISISVKQEKRNGKCWVDIVVSDTGHGISPEALPHIFDRYYQEHGAYQASGTGIGLSLVKSLVELHKGHVDVRSALDKGTDFTISLDADMDYPDAEHVQKMMEDVNNDVTAENIASDESRKLSDGISSVNEKKTILVVEDNIALREYIVDAFSKEWNVFEADDGISGLAIAHDEVPDVIVSDVMMPNMDGTEFCRKVKNDSRTSHILFIMLTAKDSLESKTEGYKAGADSYLTKPFTNALLKSRINNLMQERMRLVHQIVGTSAGVEEKKRLLRESLNMADREFFDKLEKVVSEHISGELDLGVLTQELGMSTSTLYRKIKSLTGLSPNEYIRRYKMQYAERLMLKGSYSISEIAYMVGMNSTAYFRRCFKAEYGMLPSEYLNRLKDVDNKNNETV